MTLKLTLAPTIADWLCGWVTIFGEGTIKAKLRFQLGAMATTLLVLAGMES